MPRQLVLRGTDVASRASYRLAKWGPLDLGNRVDTARFVIHDGKKTLGFVPREDDTVIYTEPDGVTRSFAGKVKQVKITNTPIGVEYECSCQGWGAMLKGIVPQVAKNYAAGLTDIAMVSDVLATFYGPIGTGLTHVLYSKRSSMPAYVIEVGKKNLDIILGELAAIADNASLYIDADKRVHWNDVLRLADFTISTRPNGTTRRKASGITHFRDAAAAPMRVKVKGAGGVEYEATDWLAFARAKLRRDTTEGAAPEDLHWQIPDITDTALTTVEQCQQRAFQELAKRAAREVVSFKTLEAGLYPGMELDITDTNKGTLSDGLYADGDDPACASADDDEMHLSMGRFMIQRVTPALLGNGVVEFAIEAGSYEPQWGAAVQRAA